MFLLTKPQRRVIIDTWLIPTNRQNLHILGNTIGIKRGVQTSLIISQYGRGSSGYQTLGLFYYPYVAIEYGTREYTCQSVKYRTADALECAGVALDLERQPQPLKLMRSISNVGGSCERKLGNFAVGVLLGSWADVALTDFARPTTRRHTARAIPFSKGIPYASTLKAAQAYHATHPSHNKKHNNNITKTNLLL